MGGIHSSFQVAEDDQNLPASPPKRYAPIEVFPYFLFGDEGSIDPGNIPVITVGNGRNLEENAEPTIANIIELVLWKLNLLAVFKNLLFIAEGPNILVYRLGNGAMSTKALLKKPCKTLYLDRSGGVELNQIRIGSLNGGTIPVLSTVDDRGEIRIFFLENLDKEPISLSNANISTWGVAVNPCIPMIAVSANSHNIYLWRLSNLGMEPTIFSGHQHNIPCIDFSPCGRYIASISIDCTAKVWNVHSAKCVASRTLGIEWGWAIRWIPKKSVKSVVITDTFWEEFKRRLRQLFPNPTLHRETDDDIESESDIETADSRTSENEEAEADITGVGSNSLQQQFTDQKNYSTIKREDSSEENDYMRIVDDDLNTSERLHHSYQVSLEDSLIICCTFHHIFLCDSSLKILNTLYNAIPRPLVAVPLFLRHMERLSLIEYMPELSLLVVACQGSASALLVRILRNAKSKRYQMLPQKILPPISMVCPIAGLSVSRHSMITDTYGKALQSSSEGVLPGNLYFYRLYILFQDSHLYTYELRKCNTEPDQLDITEQFL